MTVFVGDQQVTVSGQTGIYALEAGTTGTPAVITRVARHTIVMVTRATSSVNVYRLPVDAEIGDVVETYQDLSLLEAGFGACSMQAPSGEDFGHADSSHIQTAAGFGFGARYCKLTSDTWGVSGSNPV